MEEQKENIDNKEEITLHREGDATTREELGERREE